MTEVRVVLPLPPRKLSPNARSHWAPKARATREYRARASMMAQVAMNRRPRPEWREASLLARWWFPDARRRDPDNLVAWLKSAIDGLRDARVLADDDRLVVLPPEVAIDRANPRVELVIRPYSSASI